GGAVDDLVRFVFQAEDGIRDRNVTGVQTCALPILWPSPGEWEPSTGPHSVRSCSPPSPRPCPSGRSTSSGTKQWSEPSSSLPSRSEERRVGNEGRVPGGGDRKNNARHARGTGGGDA